MPTLLQFRFKSRQQSPKIKMAARKFVKKSALKITDRDRSGKDPATKRDRDVFAIREFGHLFQPECDIDPVGHLQPPREKQRVQRAGRASGPRKTPDQGKLAG